MERLSKTRLGFDVAPKPSGPGRYLHAIVAALDPDEFEVLVFGKPCIDQAWPHVSYLGEYQAAGADSGGSSAVLQPTSSARVRSTASLLETRNRPLIRAGSLWAGFYRDAKRLAAQIRKQNIDIFHAQNTGCEVSAVAARQACRPRILGTFHVDSTYELTPTHSSFRYRILEWYSNRCLQKAIAVSEGTKRFWMRRTGIDEKRFTTIYNGVDPDKIRRKSSSSEARRRLAIPDDSRLILGAVGRLDVAKGFTHLIDAMAILRKEFSNVLLVIAGRGPLEETLAAQVASLGLENSVSWLGFCEDVELVYDALDVFVLSSICDAMPFALLEAMAHGLPAVGTRVGGVPEVILPNNTGFLADPFDGRSLALSLRPLLASAELRKHMGIAGRKRIIEHFQEKEMISKTIGVYRSLSQNIRPALN